MLEKCGLTQKHIIIEYLSTRLDNNRSYGTISLRPSLNRTISWAALRLSRIRPNTFPKLTYPPSKYITSIKKKFELIDMTGEF